MANVFTWLITEEHTFAAWAEKELAKLNQEAPTIEKIADTVLTYAGPALQTVVTAEAGTAAGALVGKALTTAQSDPIAASGLINDFGATPSVASVIGSVQTNLSALLTATNVVSATSKATVGKVVTELGSLVAAFPVVAAVVAPAAPAVAPVA
jgi:hypothetical protein